MKSLFGKKRAAHLKLGSAGEKIALRMFRNQGYELLAKDCRFPKGEIDLILRGGLCLVFAEVKTRSKVDNYQPEANLDNNQKARIRRGARAYCRKYHVADEVVKRFDLVEVIHDGRKLHSITLHENYMAFSQAEFLTDPQVESIL